MVPNPLQNPNSHRRNPSNKQLIPTTSMAISKYFSVLRSLLLCSTFIGYSISTEAQFEQERGRQLQQTSTPIHGPRNPHLIFYGRLHDDLGSPVVGAQVQFWHADYNGNYFHPGDPLDGFELLTDSFSYFATANTDGEGNFEFKTYRPGIYPSRPITHIHFKVFYDGRELLTSQFYFSDEDIEQWFDEMLILSLEEKIDGDGNIFHQTTKTVVVDMNMGGAEKLTPPQVEGPFYPLVDFFNVTSDMTSGLLERFYAPTDPGTQWSLARPSPNPIANPIIPPPSQKPVSSPTHTPVPPPTRATMSLPTPKPTTISTAKPSAMPTSKPSTKPTAMTLLEGDLSDGPCISPLDTFCHDSRFSTFCSLIEEFDLSDFFLPSTTSSIVVFAPTNQAFEAGKETDGFDYEAMTNQEIIFVLLYHLSYNPESTNGIADLECNTILVAANGRSIQTTCDANGNYHIAREGMNVSTPKILLPALGSCQGTIYGVDNIVIPNLDDIPLYDDDEDFLAHFAMALGKNSLASFDNFVINGDIDKMEDDDTLLPNGNSTNTLIEKINSIGSSANTIPASGVGSIDEDKDSSVVNSVEGDDGTKGVGFGTLASRLSESLEEANQEGNGIRFLRSGK